MVAGTVVFVLAGVRARMDEAKAPRTAKLARVKETIVVIGAVLSI